MIAAGNDPPHNELLSKDRLAFTEHFASQSVIPDDIMIHLPSILADDKLQIFQSSIRSTDVYAHRVTKYSVHNAQWIKAASGALDKFLLAHPEMASLCEVNSVRVRLLGMQEKVFGL